MSENNLVPQLVAAGWRGEDILVEPTIVSGGRQRRPDLVLSYASYPLAVAEVVNIRPLNLPEAIDQVASYLEPLGLRYGIIRGLDRIVVYDVLSGRTNEMTDIPTARTLWENLGRDWTELDPRLARFPNNARPLRIYQQMAVARALDAICSGKKRVLIILTQGSGSTSVFLELAGKLLASNKAQRVLVVSGTKLISEQMREGFKRHQSTFSIGTDLNSSDSVICTTARTLLNNEQAKLRKLPPGRFDLLLFDVTALNEDLLPIAEHFADAVVIGRAASRSSSLAAAQFFGAAEFEYSFQDAMGAEELVPPSGFRATTLGAVADIAPGIYGMEQHGLIESATGIPVIFASDIDDDGKIQPNRRFAVPDTETGQFGSFEVHENDILLPRLSSPTRMRMAFVERDLPDKTLFSSTLMRVRVRPGDVVPREVYSFLCSQMGQRYLRGSSFGSSLQVLSPSALAELPILLPNAEAQEPADPKALSKPAMALQELQQHVVSALQGLEQQPNVEVLEQIALRLRSIAASLVPPPLPERIVSHYPTPIALAFARYQQAQFNVFEQVLRLRDLFETIGFFLYNVILADAFRRLDPVKYYVADKGARRAYNGYSNAQKMDFIQAIIHTAGSTPEELFLPRLARTSLVGSAKQLQEEFRNKISHTATAAESQQRRLVERFSPIIEAMLAELEFLTDYRMSRVKSFHWKRSQLIRTIELYQGVTPRLLEEPVDNENMLRADRDHIVLFDPQNGAVLDLHPLYQLVASEETRFETHLCFFKQRKKQTLEGESVNGAFAVTLESGDEFDALQRRILDTLPTTTA